MTATAQNSQKEQRPAIYQIKKKPTPFNEAQIVYLVNAKRQFGGNHYSYMSDLLKKNTLSNTTLLFQAFSEEPQMLIVIMNGILINSQNIIEIVEISGFHRDICIHAMHFFTEDMLNELFALLLSIRQKSTTTLKKSLQQLQRMSLETRLNIAMELGNDLHCNEVLLYDI